MHIRDYHHDDYDVVTALWQSLDLPIKRNGRDRRDRIDRQIEAGGVFLLVAEQDGEIIGTLMGSHDCRKGWINRLAVAPAFQRAPIGVAVRLLELAEQRFQSLGIEIFACLIEGHNQTSMHFFRRLGYSYFEGMAYYSKRLRPDV